MRVVAYSIRDFEKECLAKANHKKHDITLISNYLSLETLSYAEGKNAVLVSDSDDLSAAIIEQLSQRGIQFICTRTATTQHINLEAAQQKGIQVAHIEQKKPELIAEAAIANLDKWQARTCLGKSCVCAQSCREHTTPIENPKH